MVLYYQINYTLTEVPEDIAYFHAQFRRTNPLPYKEVYTLVDGIKGHGQLAGIYMAWGVNNTGWWGEGEIKFYMDGDGEFPTICGTERRIISAAPIISRINSRSNTRNLPRLMRDCRRSSAPTASMTRTDALWIVPLAHHRSGSLPQRSARHHPGAGLAIEGPLPSASGRYFIRGLLVPDVADRTVPAPARSRLP